MEIKDLTKIKRGEKIIGKTFGDKSIMETEMTQEKRRKNQEIKDISISHLKEINFFLKKFNMEIYNSKRNITKVRWLLPKTDRKKYLKKYGNRDKQLKSNYENETNGVGE